MTTILSLLLSFNLNASEGPRLETCLSKAKKFYNQHGQRSDTQRGFIALAVLKAGSPLLGLQNQTLAVFLDDKLVYQGTGSMHSGYFTDLIVTDFETCQVEQIFNIYSE